MKRDISKFAAMPELRAELLKLQRKIISDSKRGIVVEGRDIATVVAPDAALKIYLTADLNARAVATQSVEVASFPACSTKAFLAAETFAVDSSKVAK